MKILITGAAGFIGANLCEYMLEKGYTVVGLDNFATGHAHNLKAFKKRANFSFIEGDIRNLETCLEATKNVDYVLHQAALGSVPRSILDPITTNEVNVNGFLNMLEASKQNNIKRFVYAASSSTYGDSKALPKIEKNIGKPLSPYAITKYVNEIYADIYSSAYGLETIGLRYFNVFGRRQDPNGAYAAVIPKFIKLVKEGKSPTINGDGNFSRDFTYVDNVVDANILAMTTENKECFGEVFNIGAGGRVTIVELFNIIKNNMKSDIEPLFGNKRVGDIPHSNADISKAIVMLGYSPEISFEEGIKKLIFILINI